MERRYDAVIFDLHGTLIDFEAGPPQAVVRLMEDAGLVYSEEVHQINLTKPFQNLAQFFHTVATGSNLSVEPYEQELQSELKRCSLFPETTDVLTELRDRAIGCGLLSNASSAFKEPYYTLGLDYHLEQKLFSCDVGVMKPDLKIFRMILDAMQVNPKRALMVGDKRHRDAWGAMNAGMDYVILDRENCRPSIDTITSLTDVIEFMD